MSLPNVLILGGTGFIGRSLVTYMISNNLVNSIRAVDKVFPNTAYLCKADQASFDNAKVTFMQGNLISAASITKIMTPPEGQTGWDFIINCAAETRYSQAEEVYEAKVYDLAVKCATEAQKHSPKRYIHFSTARVYDSGKSPSTESGKLKPWTTIAKYHLQAEKAISALKLNKIIIRPAIVYGPADTSGITPRIIIASSYKWTDEKMLFLHSKDLGLNTVHIEDVCAAVWLLTSKGKDGEIFNLADSGNTTQGSINVILEAIFGIKTGFRGTLISKAAMAAMNVTTSTVNNKHLPPFSEMKKRLGFEQTFLTPYLDKELLGNNSLSVNGKKITELGFKYKHPKMTQALIEQQIAYFTDMKMMPKPADIPKGGSTIEPVDEGDSTSGDEGAEGEEATPAKT